ncbi:hypothetical protein SUGI_0210660 [Cryptomeria japonica]|nr:hypothetical protein SUGI_0210660 [Cryptomeria japonica]
MDIPHAMLKKGINKAKKEEHFSAQIINQRAEREEENLCAQEWFGQTHSISTSLALNVKTAEDESNATCGKRLASIALENTEANRQAYRQLLVREELKSIMPIRLGYQEA